jgi:hypothetical protein
VDTLPAETPLAETQPRPAEEKADVPTENLSPQYSSLCGILAGFAFVGFSIYLAQDTLPPQAANIAASLFAAFVTLMLLAVLYALMSADGSVNRVSIGLFVYGLPFGLSSVTLFYTLTLMATARPQLHATVEIGRVFVLLIGPAIVMARLNGGARSLKDGRASRFLPRRLGLTLVCLLVAAGLFVLIWPSAVSSLRGHGVVPAYIALGSAVVAGGLSPIIAERPADSSLSRVWVDAYLLIGFVALLAGTILAGAVLR